MKLAHLLLNTYRAKRGLVTAISWLTGNMDPNNKAKYDEILKQVQTNEYHLEDNVEKQFLFTMIAFPTLYSFP